MKILFALLLLCSTGLAGQSASKEKAKKPRLIQNIPAAKSYAHKALYEFLEKPPYLVIEVATPFVAKEIGGKSVFLSLVEFSCGLDEKHCVDCATVIIYEPVTKQHRFVNPDDLIGQAGRKSDDKETADDGSI